MDVKKFLNRLDSYKLGLVAELVVAASLIIALVSWFWSAEERDSQRYYAAWTEINTALHAPISDSTPSISTSMQRNGTNNYSPCSNPGPMKKVGDSGRSIALKELTLDEKSLAGAPLSYAVLPHAELGASNMDRIDLRHADLFGAKLDGGDLWGADLEGANLLFAHLEGSHMIYANLEEACLQGAHLSEKNYRKWFIRVNKNNFHLKAELEQKNHAWSIAPLSWMFNMFLGGKLYFSWHDVIVKTDLRHACFKGAELEWADLEDADLSYANLENAMLGDFPPYDQRLSVETSKKDLDRQFIKMEAYENPGEPLIKAWYRYAKAVGIDPPHNEGFSTNLKNAKLIGANLKSADLAGADLTGAHLTDADLTGADLTGAKGIDLDTLRKVAHLCRTIMPDGTSSGDEDCQQESRTPQENVCEHREAPGAPGNSSTWTSGAKQGIGTSTTRASKVWYTLGNGTLNEVYYPRIDLPNVEDLQFVVSDGSSFVDLERDATDHQVQLLDPRALTYRQVNTKAGHYRITKTYVTDVERPTLLIEIRFEVLSGGPYQLYVLYNPSLKGSGMGDTAATSANALVASDGSVASALIASSGFTAMSSGYRGTASDGLVDLNQHRQLTAQFDSALTPGNIVQIGQISVGQDTTATVALGFSSTRSQAVNNAQHTLEVPFAQHRSEYERGWHDYLTPLTIPRSVADSPSLRTQYNVALMAMKAHEDKTFTGAIIASLSTPWGNAINADQCCVADKGGYQAVRARDIYQVATAQRGAGDDAGANGALDYLLNTQQLPDGSFPHNTRVDGTLVPNINCGFNCQQLDEVAFPIILAHELKRTDPDTWKKLKQAADFLVAKGPFTPQERWEEAKGFSPSTIAAEIAALVCAAEMAQTNGDEAAAQIYRNKADNWQRNIESWTFTTTGPHGNHQYYIRIDDNQDPNYGHHLDIANYGGSFDEREIIDAGFLDLVRLGVKAPNDPHVIESLAKVDTTIKVNTPNGPMFHRYNHDGYGEEADCTPYPVHKGGIGRLWPLLTGERGEYELANGRSAATYLKTMALTANNGLMIAEQVSDTNDCGFTFGKGTNSATPLAWTMAQFVRLALSIDASTPIERPKVVADRYARDRSPSTSRSP